MSKLNIESSIETTLKAEGIEYGPLPEQYVEDYYFKGITLKFLL